MHKNADVPLLIVMDGRFTWTNGRPWSGHMGYERFAARYLASFDEVEILARAYDRTEASGKPVTGDDVLFRRIGSYRGAKQFLQQLPGILRIAIETARRDAATLYYLPGTLPLLFALPRIALGKKVYAFVVADPEDQLSPLALTHPLQPIVRWLYTRLTRYVLSKARVARYVTETYLQEKYPTKSKHLEHGVSDVVLNPEDYVDRPREPEQFRETEPVLVYVAMFAQRYKAHDVLIEAMALCRDRGYPVRLRLVGDGPLRTEVEAEVARHGLSGQISFAGALQSGSAIKSELDASDAFVMPSRAEGLPRALLEAMARGLPAISTKVGGIPELLASDMMVPTESPTALADKVIETLANRERLSELSAQNLETAKLFLPQALLERERQFLRAVREDFA